MEEAKSNLLVVCVGGCGSNALRTALKRHDPGKNPYLSFLGIESNRKVLKSCLSLEGDDDLGFLPQWLEQGEQLKSIQLGDLGLGAGGDIEKGEEMAKQKIADIKKYFEQFDNAILIGGGGGGTCGAMPVIAEALQELQKPTYAILTIPPLDEGPRRVEKAELIRDRLRALCPTTLIRNENIPDKNLSFSGAWTEINEHSLFWILWLLRSLLQEVGDVRDLDGSDWKSGVGIGNYTIPGFYDASKGLDGLEKGLLGNPYLDVQIIERALSVLLWFEGYWPIEDHNRVVECIQKRISNRSDPNLEFKSGIREKGVPEGTKTVGFVAFAKEGPSRAVQEAPTELPHLAVSVLPPVDVPKDNGNGKGSYVTFAGIVNGVRQECRAPQELAERYRALWKRAPSIAIWDEAEDVQKILRETTGIVFDVPTRPGRLVGRPTS